MYQEHIDVLQPCATKQVTDLDPERLYTTFRQLRNSCTLGQTVITDLYHNELFHTAVVIVDKMIKNYSEAFLPALKQGLQFIYNLSVNNEGNKPFMWSWYSYLKSWMNFHSDESIRNYVCGTLYNIVLNSNYIYEACCDITLMNSIIDSALGGADFPLLFIENIFRSDTKESDSILKNLLDSYDCNHFYLLAFLLEFLKENEVNDHYVDLIINRFRSKVSCVISGEGSDNGLKEIYMLIKLLIELSITTSVIPVLQRNIELLDSSKHLLEYIHMKGKDVESEFAPTENIFPERSNVENMKANMIRLIANLCWRNKAMQDRVRETDCIPIILDSCVRDGNNPFITETCIYAIHNLCELNIENQKLIQNLNCEVYNEAVQIMNSRSNLYIPS